MAEAGDFVERAHAVLAALRAAGADEASAERATALIATERFESVDRAKQARRWPALLEHLRTRERTDAGGGTIRRADVAGDCVFLEVDEDDGTGGTTTTMTVLEFEPDGRVCRMDRFG